MQYDVNTPFEATGDNGPLLREIDEAIAALRRGEMIVVVDDEDRENEGDLLMPAAHATSEAINFMITHGRGLVCVPISEARAAELELPPMVQRNEDHHGTAFTVSVDASPEDGVSTGISAPDRAKTIELMIDGVASNLRRPGHIFPLIAKEGGVLRRAGHTEAAVDFARLAGCPPIGVIVEIIKEDGTMARLPDLVRFSRNHGLVITSIEKLQMHLLLAGAEVEDPQA